MKYLNHAIFSTKVNAVLLFLFTAYLFVQAGCDKNTEPDFTAAFTYEFKDANHVKFTNQSTGEYYSATWNFGNGQSETTTDKNKTFEIYYPEAGDYTVLLRLTNYTGSNKTAEQTINIATTDDFVSFTAEIDPANPNYVNLKNTTEGEYDSFKWIYSNMEVENELETIAYFPFAGNYEIELQVIKNGSSYSKKQTVTITQDDPNFSGLIWSEEFDYTGLPDAEKWNMETGGNGWGNNELQYYTNTQNNAKVENGILTITAREETLGDRDYTSARITTQSKFDFKYGMIEARIKLPYGQGLWPAFWMLGANFSSVGWPQCGEIDIMEMVGGAGKENTTHTTLHWDNNGDHAQYGESYSLSSGILADDFHIFSVEWDNQEIRGFIDDIQYFTADITPGQMSEFHNNFFIILNVAVGGNWPGPPDGTTTFPQTMQVDYIRVFQLPR